MTTKDLQQYLAGVLSIELDIFVQTKTISELTHRYNSLARRKNLYPPQPGKPEISLIECMIVAGIICGIIVGIICLIYEWGNALNFFYYIAAVIVALFYAVGGLLAGGVVFGFLVWLILHTREKKKLDKKLQNDMDRYDAEVRRQNERVAREKAQQAVLAREIATLRNCLKTSKEHLAKVYAYGVLAPEYRNIYAVSSMHGYLMKGRTHCLQFNEQTGDQGAYNIYENECRLDRIITNTEEVLCRFDQVVRYQQDLAVGLQNASQRIDSLCSNVNTQLSRISSSVNGIERCQSVIAYNSECAARELAFLNWVNTVY